MLARFAPMMQSITSLTNEDRLGPNADLGLRQRQPRSDGNSPGVTRSINHAVNTSPRHPIKQVARAIPTTVSGRTRGRTLPIPTSSRPKRTIDSR
jgi:hypothetical protein